MDKQLAKRAGLVPAGTDEEGQPEFVGTTQQWDEYQRLEQEQDNSNWYLESIRQ